MAAQAISAWRRGSLGERPLLAKSAGFSWDLTNLQCEAGRDSVMFFTRLRMNCWSLDEGLLSQCKTIWLSDQA